MNKADRDGADVTARELRTMLAIGRNVEGEGAPAWRPPILKTVASRAEGIDELLDEIDRHRTFLVEHDELGHRRRLRAKAEIEALVVAGVRARLIEGDLSPTLNRLAADVVSGTTDPYSAAATLTQ